jgi:hypothetical protein
MTMRKNQELSDPASCLNKAADDEPIFVLRGKDPVTPAAIRAWAEHAEVQGLHEREKRNAAREFAVEVEEWQAAQRAAAAKPAEAADKA